MLERGRGGEKQRGVGVGRGLFRKCSKREGRKWIVKSF